MTSTTYSLQSDRQLAAKLQDLLARHASGDLTVAEAARLATVAFREAGAVGPFGAFAAGRLSEACGVDLLRDADERPATQPGTLHHCEPESEEHLLAGALWEAELEGEGPEHVLPIDVNLLDPLLERGVPGIQAVKDAWVAAGRPIASDGGAPFIEDAVRLALAAGLDAYDSDTRSWVYAEPVTCGDSCAEDCRGPVPAADRLRQAFGALLDAVEAWGGGAECMGCERQTDDAGSCQSPGCPVYEARQAYDAPAEG